MVVGLSGYAGAGKSTAAQALVDKGWHLAKFAEGVRRAALAIDPYVSSFPSRRLSGVVNDHGWEKAKETVEVRRILQVVGTEAGRAIHGEECWNQYFLRNLPACRDVVVDDVRFQNEVDLIHSLGGVVFRVIRPGTAPGDHATENQELEFDDVLPNNGMLGELRVLTRIRVAGWSGKG